MINIAATPTADSTARTWIRHAFVIADLRRNLLYRVEEAKGHSTEAVNRPGSRWRLHLLEDGAMGESQHPTPRRYPPELKERAVRLVDEAATEGERHGAITRIAQQLGIGPESVRQWVRQARIDRGELGGLASLERARLKEFERENRELRRANEILKSAAAFFGAEPDRRSPR
jgi:transposase